MPRRWGYAARRPRAAAHAARSTRTPQRPGVSHQADYYRDLVTGLGVSVRRRRRRRAWRPSHRARERAHALLAASRRRRRRCRSIGFAPGAAYGQAKQWPPDRMAEVDRAPRARARRALRASSARRTIAMRGACDRILASRARTGRGSTRDQSDRPHQPRRARRRRRADAGVRVERFRRDAPGGRARPAGRRRSSGRPTNARPAPSVTIDVITEPVFCRPCLLRDCPIDHRCMKRISADASTPPSPQSARRRTGAR